MVRIFLLLCFGLVGCATAPNLNNVALGMTKQEVIKTLGNPHSVSAKDNTEYLKYGLSMGFADNSVWANPPEYYVRLVNGKVESYGKVGDFDSTKNPAADVNLNVKTESK